VSNGTSTSTGPDGSPTRGGASLAENAPEVGLCLPAAPANVALVRQALAGLADELGLEASRVADMKIAITEACTNAVVHAYETEGGRLEVTMTCETSRLVLSVRDYGRGMRHASGEREGPPLGFGLSLIASLADEFGIAGGRRGTEVRMAFALDGATDSPPLVVQLAACDPEPVEQIVLTLVPGNRGAAVLSRVVSLVAARSDFSIDRLSDVQIVSDAIAGGAPAQALDGALSVSIDEREDGFELGVGPLAPGGAQRLLSESVLPGLGYLLDRLADQVEIEPAEDPESGERLRVRIDARA
jgi:anti-sigma regulatory factor (Ser/Thr protein kinase)